MILNETISRSSEGSSVSVLIRVPLICGTSEVYLRDIQIICMFIGKSPHVFRWFPWLRPLQVWLPWQRLQGQYLPSSNWRDRLLHCICRGSFQLWRTHSETLPRTHGLRQVVRTPPQPPLHTHTPFLSFSQMTSRLCDPVSLAIHPDKIRIATGQIAGVDKDGRVWRVFLYIYIFHPCSWTFS